MKLVTYRHVAHGDVYRAGLLQGDRVLDAARLLGESTPLSMLALLDRGPRALSDLAAAAEQFAADNRGNAAVPAEIAVPRWEARLRAPLPEPRSVRDFMAFEQHVAASYVPRGRPIPPAWFTTPVFYIGHNGNIFGTDETVDKPVETCELDFELELAVVIGREGRNIPAAQAWDYVAGFTILNDWSARDLQRQEMGVLLGPSKGKDFATSIGPALVTLDELRGRVVDDRIDLTMIARINDEEVGRAQSGQMHWTFPQLVEHAARNVTLRPGDVLASGTCGNGCLFELGQAVYPWLQPGDEVKLEIEGIGRLRNTIG